MVKVFDIHGQNPEKRHIRQVALAIAAGEIILAPNDTGYCFVGSGLLPSTHARFLRFRSGHPKEKPFSVLCQNITQVAQCAVLSTQVFRVATRVWPGPYTLILPCHKKTPKTIAGPKRTALGVRIPDHRVMQDLLLEVAEPLLVTSVTDEDELIAQDYFADENATQNAWWTGVEGILDRCAEADVAFALRSDEPVPIRVSTVVDFSQGENAVLLRDGGHDTTILGFG